MLDAFIHLLDTVSWPVAALGFFVENLLIVVVSVGIGRLVERTSMRRVTPRAPPIEAAEWALVGSTLVINTLITFAGWWLWRLGIVRFRDTLSPVELAADVLVLAFVMDLLMYVLHRVAHLPGLFRWLHAPHHRYAHPRPLTLFALHPAEAVGFGALWLALVSVYSATWVGMGTYLGLNVVFGLVGHLGVEPLPRWVARVPGLRSLTTSAFHAGHHVHVHGNYGFYTRIWDQLAGTLLPDDNARFHGLPALSDDPP